MEESFLGILGVSISSYGKMMSTVSNWPNRGSEVIAG